MSTHNKVAKLILLSCLLIVIILLSFLFLLQKSDKFANRILSLESKIGYWLAEIIQGVVTITGFVVGPEEEVPPPTPPPSGRGAASPPLPPPPEVCKGADFNKDGIVNSVDFSILLYFWKTQPPFRNSCVDINKDGQVNSIDFSILLYQWGKQGTNISWYNSNKIKNLL